MQEGPLLCLPHLAAYGPQRDGECLKTVRASPDGPGLGEASTARNWASPWQARPAVQLRDALHTLLCIHNHLPTQAQMQLVSIPLMHSRRQGRLSFSSNEERGIIQFLGTDLTFFCCCCCCRYRAQHDFWEKPRGQDRGCSVSTYWGHGAVPDAALVSGTNSTRFPALRIQNVHRWGEGEQS